MQFNRQVFLNILANHQSNLDKKAINPIFSSIKLITNDKELKIISTDGQRYLEQTMEGSFENSSLFINGITLYEILKKSKSESFMIKETFEFYKILIDNAEFKFSKQITSEFPEWPNEYENNCKIKADILLEGLKTVKWAASLEEARPSLTGVCFDFCNNVLNLCSTDSLRLAIFKIFDNYFYTKKIILGKKSITELIKLLEDFGSTEINFYVGTSVKIIGKTNNLKTTWKSLCINGNFPNYEKLLSDKKIFNASFVCNAQEILEIITRIMVVSNQHQHTLILKFKEKENSKISAENAISEGEDILVGEYTGKTLKILFDGKFLEEMLNNIDGKIIFEITDPFSPINIKKIENNGSLFILAPIRPDL
ncbi:DNA polymerase III subunit beta [Alphaproteobacteria bacterium endosymbiont of Tiliacea citrago]|uniref:DNA polymerase III subunit beta n=1 Tax=Alphaproteobacteria bacterium endosymbiont of Tiliacea citrago TaxID=3077944 RepID=UPI00313E696C